MCLVPIVLTRKVQTIQGSNTNVVPCGKCPECLKRRYMSWAFRLIKQSEISTSAIFLTLTYNDEHLPCKHYQSSIIYRGVDALFKLSKTESINGINPILIKEDYQLFIKRLRKAIPNSNIKYYACGEYGAKTQRPHYHAIMFNLPQNWTTNPNYLMEVWGKGNILIAPCNIATIKYVTKYIMKDYNSDQKTFALMSKNMGLNYLSTQMVQYHKNHLKASITLPGGILHAMPRYYRNKIFTIGEQILINEKSTENRRLDINQFKTDPIWIHDQFRKDKKKQRLERLAL